MTHNTKEGSMSTEYHKIQSIWKRTTNGVFMPWDWSRPELGYLANNEWEWTEKVDGTNIRLWQEGGTLRVGGRTDNAQIPASLLAGIAEYDDLGARMAEHLDPSAVLYGEGYGAKIQKGGGNYRADQGFVLFDVNIGGFWLDRASVEDVAVKLGLDYVPLIFKGTIHEAIEVVAPGMRSTWGDFAAEGLVGKPVVPLFNRKGERIVCKVKVCDFTRLSREGIAWGGAA